jgi:hypothetical protein
LQQELAAKHAEIEASKQKVEMAQQEGFAAQNRASMLNSELAQLQQAL